MRSSVDLPQPEGPTSTTNSLSAMSTLTPCSTSTEPNALRTLRMSTVAIPGPHLRRARTQSERCVVGAASRVEQFPAPASIIPDRRNIKDKHRVCGKRAAVGTCSPAPALQHSTMRGQVTRRYRRAEGGIGAGNAGSRPLFVETLGPARAGGWAGNRDQCFRSEGTLPPFSASLIMTCLCSQMFIAAEFFVLPSK